MTTPDESKPSPNRTVQVCAIIFVAIGIVAFQAVGPTWFPTPPGGGFNYERMFWAGVVGATCAVVGAGIGKLIDEMRK